MSKGNNKKRELSKLVLLAKSGDTKALEELIRKIQKEIYAFFSHLCEKKEMFPT